MPAFIHDDFLLQSPQAIELYQRYAAAEPILDYHCHLPPRQIAENHAFADLSELWLGGDHYKWRAMRSNGVDERFCLGDAAPRPKHDAWCATVPHTLGNPLYHWSHLELKRHFGLDLIINPANAAAIWREANARLASLRVHDLLKLSRVAVVCTTDDPAESLEDHVRIAQLGIATRVYPTFRPDQALGVDNPKVYAAWLEKLGAVAYCPVLTLDDLLTALKCRHDDFHAAGGRLSDHGLEQALAEPCSHVEAAAIFKAARAGRPATPVEWAQFGSYLMLQFGRWDAAKGWTKQLHLGALRSANSRLRQAVGRDCGFDSIGDFPQARALARYLDALDRTDELPRMVLYNLNPADNYVFATMIGNFNVGAIPGKIQFGSGWWFLDQKEAMEWQLSALANLGLLSRFVGMLTDSRSFLSFTRHEYFRRVLCNLLGTQMTRGEIPPDLDLVGGMVRNICFANARDYFRLSLDRSFSAPG
jgi:glucuronate isomerase